MQDGGGRHLEKSKKNNAMPYLGDSSTHLHKIWQDNAVWASSAF